jgi:death-on-curing protein
MANRYLTVTEVVFLHDGECGPTYVDSALLESAVGRPQVSAFGEDAYGSLHLKVAALFYSLCENQAFEDGNKRTAVLAAYAMYGLNGFLLPEATSELVDLAFAIAAHDADVHKVAEVFEALVEPLPEPDE